MCGRYAAAKDPAALAVEFDVTGPIPDNVAPDFNMAPTKNGLIVVDRMIEASDQVRERTLERAKWGLVPRWAKDASIANRMINARAETVAEKPAYRSAFAKRRCLVPADGFYEWYQSAGDGSRKTPKQPFFIHRTDGHSLAMAGLYEWWRDPTAAEDDKAAWLLSFTVITTDATDEVGRIHDRMPMTISRDGWSSWLDPNVGAEVASTLLEPASQAPLEAYPVSTLVSNVRNNGPDLLVPLPAEDLFAEIGE